MVYDVVLSIKDRKNSEKEHQVYWCMKCDIIIRIQKKIGYDKVISVRAVIFKNKKTKYEQKWKSYNINE